MNTIDLLANNLANAKGASTKTADGLDQGTDFSASLQSAGLQSDATNTPGLTRLATTPTTVGGHAAQMLAANGNAPLFSLLQANPRLAPQQAGEHLKDPLTKDQHKRAGDAAAAGLPLTGQIPLAALAPTDAASPAKPQPALHAGQTAPLTGQSALTTAQAHIRVLSDITSGPKNHQAQADRQQQLSTLIQTHGVTAAQTTPASSVTTPVPTWTPTTALANMPRINHANRHLDHLDLAIASTSAAPMGLHTGAAGKAVTLAMPAVLASPIGSAGWQQELSQQLVHMTQRGTQHMELHLHPRELGPLQISLQLNQNTAQAQFLAAHAQVRDAVQQALPQLREALAGQGIALGQALVGQQQQQSQQQSGNFSKPRSLPAIGGIDTDMSLAQPVHTTVNMPLTTNGGVDLYA